MRRLVGVAIAVLGLLVVGVADALTPSDPDAGHWAYQALDLPAAWAISTGSPRPVIAIVDSGVDPTHPELAGAVLPGYDFVVGKPGATPVDGHGTGVAGTAAGRAGNGVGGVGACFECSVLPLQVVGSNGIALNVDVAEAIDHAVDRGVAVVNISLIGPNSPPQLEAAIARARAAGVLVVAAAGNEATDAPRFPAGVPGAVSVGAVTADGRRASFSNHGSWVKFSAPECAPIAVLHGGAGVGCGTSMSSPLVAGIVALMRTRAPYASAADIEARLARSARATPGTTFGIPDAAVALRLLENPEPRLDPTILGRAAVGSTLEAFSGIWVGAGIHVRFQWERCRLGECSPIPGATGPHYAPTPADGGRRLRVGVVAEELGTGAASLQTAPVASRPRVVARPTIAGRARVGSRLLARPGRWAGQNVRFAITWERCRGGCVAVGDGWTHVLRKRDRGSSLRIVVHATNSVGSGVARSEPTRVVR